MPVFITFELIVSQLTMPRKKQQLDNKFTFNFNKPFVSIYCIYWMKNAFSTFNNIFEQFIIIILYYFCLYTFIVSLHMYRRERSLLYSEIERFVRYIRDIRSCIVGFLLGWQLVPETSINCRKHFDKPFIFWVFFIDVRSLGFTYMCSALNTYYTL